VQLVREGQNKKNTKNEVTIMPNTGMNFEGGGK
jgi:hypothetical protein